VPEGDLIASVDGRLVGGPGAPSTPIPDGPAPSEQPFVIELETSVAPASSVPGVPVPDVAAKEPAVKDAELSDHTETDNDVPDAKPGADAARGDDDAVHAALRWLAAHQSPDGGWESDGFAEWCDGKPASAETVDGRGKPQYGVGVTGLALLAYL